MKKVRILSLDGGGIRGIIPATIMKYVEEQLQIKDNNPDARIADYFDLVAGTSTGGILSCLYLTPDKDRKVKFTAKEALEFYSKQGYTIFNESKIPKWKRFFGLANATKFSPKNIEMLFQQKLGDTRMSEMLKPCMITTYNMETKSAFFFTSTDTKTERDFYVRDVVRSTSAAPTYFPPAKVVNLASKDKMMNIDGGVFANNPLMCAYAEARNTNFKPERDYDEPTASQMHILSIGTGGGGFELPVVAKSQTWGLVKWATSIPEIMMDGSVDTVAFQMNEMFGTLEKEHHSGYLRLDVPNTKGNDVRKIYAADMSDASPENIKNLLKAGELTLKKAIDDGLDGFIDGLIDEKPVA
ncbi:MAG: patatin-like phospholipase family protein [Crocinitomicaceae bacterium]|nr:patatin-like phospholipase family protein [Crocinitomicaceae bacterium]